jgi:hypothetical protein
MKKTLFLLASIVFFKTINAQNYQVSTVVGSGTQGYLDTTAQNCQMYWPYGLASDNDSAIYFSDAANHRVRKFNIVTTIVTTIGGNGNPGLKDGIGDSAMFNWPDALFYKNGFLYVGDNQNNAVRKIDLSTNMVTTIAGNGTPGYKDGPADSSLVRNPGGIVVDSVNDIYFADDYNYCIRKISNGIVSTVAGVPGTFGYQDGAANQALFHRPRYITLDSNGVMYITDINNNVVRKYTNGIVSTFAGTGVAGGADGTDSTATFSAPVGIASTYNNFLYVVDGGGNKLRKIDPQGNVSTIAGNGVFGFYDGGADSAEFFYPQGVTYDEHGIIYMADRDNNRIRKISLPQSEAKIKTATGIKTLLKTTNISIHPNPSSSMVTIEVLNVMENSTYKAYNTLGQEVKSGNLTQTTNQINVQELTNGVYTIVVSQKDKISTAKIIVQK